MKSKNVKQSKYKNTGVLFEILVRQVTTETMANKPTSAALDMIKKYFNANTEMGKELQLYRAFIDATASRPLSEAKALDFIALVVDQRKKLDENKLAIEKYNLIKEIKDVYDLREFLSCKIPDYTLHASIYKTFFNEVAKEKNVNILNIRDVATARFTLVEHLVTKTTKRTKQTEQDPLEEFRKQSEDVRVLAHKFAVDRFNEKYGNLNVSQKSLLREYINNINTETFKKYISNEIPVLKNNLVVGAKKTKDKIISIKLNEVANQLDSIRDSKAIKDSDIAAILIAYEILKEISHD